MTNQPRLHLYGSQSGPAYTRGGGAFQAESLDRNRRLGRVVGPEPLSSPPSILYSADNIKAKAVCVRLDGHRLRDKRLPRAIAISIVPTTTSTSANMHSTYLQYKSDDFGNPLTAKVCWSLDESSSADTPKVKPIGRFTPLPHPNADVESQTHNIRSHHPPHGRLHGGKCRCHPETTDRISSVQGFHSCDSQLPPLPPSLCLDWRLRRHRSMPDLVPPRTALAAIAIPSRRGRHITHHSHGPLRWRDARPLARRRAPATHQRRSSVLSFPVCFRSLKQRAQALSGLRCHPNPRDGCVGRECRKLLPARQADLGSAACAARHQTSTEKPMAAFNFEARQLHGNRHA